MIVFYSMQNTIIPRPELMVFGRGIPLLNHLMGVTLAKNTTICPVFWSYLLKKSSHIFLFAEFMDVLHGIRTILMVFKILQHGTRCTYTKYEANNLPENLTARS